MQEIPGFSAERWIRADTATTADRFRRACSASIPVLRFVGLQLQGLRICVPCELCLRFWVDFWLGKVPPNRALGFALFKLRPFCRTMMAGPGGWRHSAAARVAEDSPARDDTWHERIARAAGGRHAATATSSGDRGRIASRNAHSVGHYESAAPEPMVAWAVASCRHRWWGGRQ